MAEATPATPAAAAPAAPTPGTPAHDAAMAARMDAGATAAAAAAANEGTPAAAPAKAERPAHIPEKFWNADKGEVNVEALAKSYTELEKVKPATPAAVVPPTPGATTTLPTDADTAAAAKAVTDAGLDMKALQAEFVEKGDLTPETRAALAAKGLPAEMVDGYIAGQKALAADYDASVKQVAGGEEEYGKLAEWAKSGLTNPEKIAFNKAVTSGDKAQASLAVAGLKARMGTALGNPPAAAVNGNNTTPAGDVYESMAQVKTDMKNPLYKDDPAFRAKVYAKLDRSNFGAISTQSMA